MSLEKRIFKEGSTTYFWSSAFFPKAVKEDVFRLYSFVRVIDNYVDVAKPDQVYIRELYKTWQQCQKTGKMPSTELEDQAVIGNIVTLTRLYNFDVAWIEAFWQSMFMDMSGHKYKTMQDTLTYMYGSAEVIGLMMSRILGLDEQADQAARLQGRAMQYINFIRDVKEDLELGRCYFPDDVRQRYGLSDDLVKDATEKPKAWDLFLREQIGTYQKWQTEANAGMHFIPRRLRIPVQCARDMYGWTAKEIARHPQLVFDKKIKPSPIRVLFNGGKQFLLP